MSPGGTAEAVPYVTAPSLKRRPTCPRAIAEAAPDVPAAG